MLRTDSTKKVRTLRKKQSLAFLSYLCKSVRSVVSLRWEFVFFNLTDRLSEDLHKSLVITSKFTLFLRSPTLFFQLCILHGDTHVLPVVSCYELRVFRQYTDWSDCRRRAVRLSSRAQKHFSQKRWAANSKVQNLGFYLMSNSQTSQDCTLDYHTFTIKCTF